MMPRKLLQNDLALINNHRLKIMVEWGLEDKSVLEMVAPFSCPHRTYLIDPETDSVLAIFFSGTAVQMVRFLSFFKIITQGDVLEYWELENDEIVGWGEIYSDELNEWSEAAHFSADKKLPRQRLN